jgi:DNA-binding transcriptional ArsR family regulator
MPRRPAKPVAPPPAGETFSRPFKQAEQMTVSTLEQLKVISDPQRLEILEAVVQDARTVKQIADFLGKPATKLYYHMSALEGAGFVTVVETRIKSGIVEKYYRTVAQSIKVDHQLLKNRSGKGGDAIDTMIATIFDSTADEIRRSIAAGLFKWPSASEEHPQNVVMGRSLINIPEEQVPRFVAKLTKLYDEFSNSDYPGAAANYAFVVAFYPRVAAGVKSKRKIKRSAK